MGHPFSILLFSTISVLVADENKRLGFLLVDDPLHLVGLRDDAVSVHIKYFMRHGDIIHRFKVEQQAVQLFQFMLHGILVKTFVFHQDKQIAIGRLHFLSGFRLGY